MDIQNWNEFNLIIITINEKGIITAFNKFAERATGYDEFEVIGQNWIGFLVYEKDREKTSMLFYDSLCIGRKYWSCKNRIQCKDKTKREITWKISFISNTEEFTLAMFGVESSKTEELDRSHFKGKRKRRDRDDFMKIKSELTKLREEEELFLKNSRITILGEMIVSIMHQCKQPLNIMKMHSDLVNIKLEKNMGFQKEDFKKFSQNMQVQIDHLNNTFEEIRDFFRSSREKIFFNVRTLLNSVLEIIYDDLLLHNITVKIEEQNEVQIWGVKSDFKHVLLNLINNAKDAFKTNEIEEKCITFRIYSEKGYNYFEVEDNAGGIEESIIENIFDVNFTTKNNKKNEGIGLYLVKKMVKKQNGNILVSNQKYGAKFTMKFRQHIQENSSQCFIPLKKCLTEKSL